MKSTALICALICALIIPSALPLAAQGTAPPFVEYPPSIAAYLQRIQQGKQLHAFDDSLEFSQWQNGARQALAKLIGLKRMHEELSRFKPQVKLGTPDTSEMGFTRTLCSIETEPGVVIPFYLLVPTTTKTDQRRPLLLCPHGHDKLGLHSYAGAFQSPAHRRSVLSKSGDIGAQAALRGYVVIAPATRGLATEVLIPDPKQRHGNRPCRAQLMHCLLGGRTPLAERVWDMQRLLDWAESQSAIDASRIVMTGNSGGGVLTAYTAAIDTRIRAAIPSCSFAPVKSASGFIFHCDCCLVPGLRDWGDWKELAGLIAPRHLLIVHGVQDGLHHRPTIDTLGEQIKTIFTVANAADHTDLQWGSAGHRFYPELMWPFIEQALSDPAAQRCE